MNTRQRCPRRPLAMLPLLLVALSLAAVGGCREQIQVAGEVHEHADPGGTSVPIEGAIVTFTSEGGTTYNFTSVETGRYSIHLPEGTYTVQVVHPDYQLNDEPQSFTGVAEHSPYTRHFDMRSRS